MDNQIEDGVATDLVEDIRQWRRANAMDELGRWTLDYDMSPSYSTAMPDLFAILAKLVPSERWEGLSEELREWCERPVED